MNLNFQPMSDWEDTKRDPFLIWRSRMDEMFLVEVQHVPFSDEMFFCVFDKDHELECVYSSPVYKVLPFEDGEPAREDTEDWAHKLRYFLESVRAYA